MPKSGQLGKKFLGAGSVHQNLIVVDGQNAQAVLLFQARHVLDDPVDAGIAHVGAVERRLGAKHAFEGAAARRHDEKLLGQLGEPRERRKRLFHAVGIDIDQRVVDVDDLVQVVVDRRDHGLLLQFRPGHPGILRDRGGNIVGLDQNLQPDLTLRIAGCVEVGAFRENFGIGRCNRRPAGHHVDTRRKP